jgi:hypothetical protein
MDGGGGVHSGTKKAGSRKRPLELEQEEGRERDNVFKCNYWEDPAHAYMVQLLGLHFVLTVVVLNNTSKVL